MKLDLAYVLRVLRASPAFTLIAVCSLAIGIGGNTVMFSVARFALIDPLPVARPSELRLVQWSGPSTLQVSQYNSGGSTDPVTGRAIRTNYNHAGARALEEGATTAGVEVFAFNFLSQVTVAVPGRPALAAGGLLASGRYFPVLRPALAKGRGLTPADDTAAAPNVAVISHAFWQRAFGGDADVIGSAIQLNGQPFTIVGVTVAGYHGLSTGSRFAPHTDVTVAIAKQPVVWTPEGGSLIDLDNRLWLRVMARVPEGADDATVARALTTPLRSVMGGASFMTADARDIMDVVLRPGARGIDYVARNAGNPLAILSGVVGVVLLIACVNLAGLSLARGVSRSRELSVRRALGASRGRLIRQLLLESLVIAIGGGLLGVLLAVWLFPIASAMVTSGFGAPEVTLPFDWRTLALTAAAAGVAGLLFGILPALGLTRDTGTHLRHRVAGGVTPKLTIGRALLTLQIAISVPLVVTAGLLIATIANLERIDLGFDPSGIVMFRLDPNQGQLAAPGSPSGLKPTTVEIERFTRDLIARIETVPGVRSATLIENALLSGWVSNNNITIDGERKSIHMNAVGPRYFDTMRIPLLAGRAPTLDDTRTTAQVAVVNETAARQLFGSARPIGRHFTMGRRDIEVVGVAADAKYSDLRTTVPPTMFDPYLQRGSAGALYVVVRGDATIPITDFRTQIEQRDLAMGSERLVAQLMAVFSAFALLLACIGLYGATSYAVARRTNEIGVRVALGAQRGQVLWLILRQVLTLALVGLAIGIPAAVAAGPLVGSLLYGLGPHDASTIVIAGVVMLVVALAAGFVPARRAARMEALQALRQE